MYLFTVKPGDLRLDTDQLAATDITGVSVLSVTLLTGDSLLTITNTFYWSHQLAWIPLTPKHQLFCNGCNPVRSCLKLIPRYIIVAMDIPGSHPADALLQPT